MESTVWDRDRPLLREIVRRLDADGPGVDPRRVGATIGMGHEAVDRAAVRLADAGMLYAMRGDDRVLSVHAVSEKGLRASGEWPASTHEGARGLLLAVLDDAANGALDAEERLTLQAVRSALAGLSVNTLGGVAAMAVVKLMGWDREQGEPCRQLPLADPTA